MRKKKAPSNAGEIPAWFMTYSDVITLLMTFFILLMTFSTHAKERTEKTKVTLFSKSGGSGVAGEKANRPAKDSWVNRIRTHSAKIALRGAEMPPITTDPPTEAIGRGLRTLTEEEEQQSSTTNHVVEVPIASLVDSMNNVTPQGEHFAETLANQLRDLNVQVSLVVSSQENGAKLIPLTMFLFHHLKVRPGLIAVSVSNGGVANNNTRIVIEKYEVK